MKMPDTSTTWMKGEVRDHNSFGFLFAKEHWIFKLICLYPHKG
jgi:hypothetical protein